MPEHAQKLSALKCHKPNAAKELRRHVSRLRTAADHEGVICVFDGKRLANDPPIDRGPIVLARNEILNKKLEISENDTSVLIYRSLRNAVAQNPNSSQLTKSS